MKVLKYEILINGQKYKIYGIKFITILESVNYINYQNKLSILEYNGKILPNLAQNYYLINRDFLEIITIVGGG